MRVSMNRPAMDGALRALEPDVALAAGCQARVLITGGEGIGTAAIARRIHESGGRAGQPFESVCCEGMPDWTLAAQLFGQVDPARPAATRRIGAFERACGGTLLLDGIDDLSTGIQARLLRYIDFGEIQPIGADRPLTNLDVRLIFASSQPLAARVASGCFRPDLFYRLNVIHIVVPRPRHRDRNVGAPDGCVEVSTSTQSFPTLHRGRRARTMRRLGPTRSLSVRPPVPGAARGR